MQDAAAKVIPIARSREGGDYSNLPVLHDRVQGNSREIFVKKCRDTADAIERGELDGARLQWLDTHGLHIEDGIATTGIETVTRTAWTEDGSGKVQLVCLTVEEV